jgi:cysteine desulfurase
MQVILEAMALRRIYLDYHATTPLDPRVLDAMLPYLREEFGNPSSKTHPYGWAAQEAVEKARGQVAALLGAKPKEIVFTSGATESNNLALLGAAACAPKGRDHIVTQATEHHAVLDTLHEIERRGFRVTVLQPDGEGFVRMDELRRTLSERTLLASFMAANNEIGTFQPLAAISAACREVGALLHTDAAQAAGKTPIDVHTLGVDLLSLSAHKFCGPKGCGALFVRRSGQRVQIKPLNFGGGQEDGLRPGTLNVPGIVGLAEASRIARDEMAAEQERVGALRDHLLESLRRALPDLRVNGPRDSSQRLRGNLSMSFPGVDGSALLVSLQDIAASAGSACTAGSSEPSYVLKAIGVSNDLAASTLRVGLGRFTTEDEVDYAAQRIAENVRKLRRTAPAR